jgi:hypothetical protein
VRRDHDADPELAADAADQFEHVAPPERVEPGRRLVEKREHGVVDERLRELHALLHAGRVRAHRPVTLLEQADVPEHVRGPQPRRRAREAADLGHVGEELRGRRARRQTIVLGRVADARPVLDRPARVASSTSTEPASASISPIRIFSEVVLPAPFEPSKPVTPSPISKLAPSSARTDPKLFVTPETRTSCIAVSVFEPGKGRVPWPRARPTFSLRDELHGRVGVERARSAECAPRSRTRDSPGIDPARGCL